MTEDRCGYDFLRQVSDGLLPEINPAVGMRDEVNRLQLNCAALLQRWAIVYNMCQAGDSVDDVFAVARLSAEEVVARGFDFGGERLLRCERTVRVLRAMKGFLDEGHSINPGSPQHEYISEALASISSYSKEQVAKGAL